MNIFDAIGLGIFTITGIQATVNVGFGGNFFLIICLGVITGIGGGILRDIMSREIPLVLHKQVYALASICGGTFYYFLYQQMNIDYTYAALLGIGIVVTIRLFAAYFRWDLPKAVPDEIKV